MIRSHLGFQNLGVLLFAAGASIACMQPVDEASEQVGQVSDEIIGGSFTSAPKYGAVGALVWKVRVPGAPDFVSVKCSGTLVAPKVVLTARHCTPAIDQQPEASYFAFGSNAYAADRYVPVSDSFPYLNAPRSTEHPGLLFDGGRDVAVVYLKAPVGSVKPAKIGRFEESMLGSQFEVAGFGYSETTSPGLKFAGVATARSLEGLWYSQLFFGSKPAYFDWYFSDAFTSDPPSYQEANAWWSLFELEPGYEMLAGGLEGEAVSCFGDSGGPLLRGTSASDMTVYGVGFASEASKSKRCDLGSAFVPFYQQDIIDFVNLAVSLAP